MIKYSNKRNNAVTCLIEVEDLHGSSTITTSEWWNGEGVDFELRSNDSVQKFHFTSSEAQAILVALMTHGMVDLEASKAEVEKIERRSEEQQRVLEQSRKLSGGF